MSRNNPKYNNTEKNKVLQSGMKADRSRRGTWL